MERRLAENLTADLAAVPLACGLRTPFQIEPKVQNRWIGLPRILSIGIPEIRSETLTRPTQKASLDGEKQGEFVVCRHEVGRKPACGRLLPGRSASIRQPHWHRHLDVNALRADVAHRKRGSITLPRVGDYSAKWREALSN